MIALGQKVKDRVTGFTGIAVAKVEYLNGCIQFCVKPEMSEPGKMPDGQYIDDHQLEIIGEGIVVARRETGGPSPDTPPVRYGG